MTVGAPLPKEKLPEMPSHTNAHISGNGYTRFYDHHHHPPRGNYVTCYPATPSNARRRMQDLQGKLKKAGLPWPAPSKKEQRSQRKQGGAK